MLRVGRFGNPPSLADVARLELEKGDIDALASCEPRDCDVKIGAAFADLRAAVDWRGPDRAVRVNAFVRQRLVDYVKAYRERGDAALVTYVDGANPVSLARRMARPARGGALSPRLRAAASTLPGGVPAGELCRARATSSSGRRSTRA